MSFSFSEHDCTLAEAAAAQPTKVALTFPFWGSHAHCAQVHRQIREHCSALGLQVQFTPLMKRRRSAQYEAFIQGPEAELEGMNVWWDILRSTW